MSEKCMYDQFGRKMRKLRISLLDACNQRCIYCMPEEANFSKQQNLLPLVQLSEIAKNLILLGITEIRLTGGEPTLRHGYLDFIKSLKIKGLHKLSLTTNGLTLNNKITNLKNNGLDSINFSLDSLKKYKFKYITRQDGLHTVFDNILKAQSLGLSLKINCVVMKGVNDDEIIDFVKFSSENNIEVRFLETMNIGVARAHFKKWFMPAEDMIKLIEHHYEFKKISTPLDSTSFIYTTKDGARIGFIASESRPFCGHCSRLRLDSMGFIRPCLFKNDGLSLVDKNIDEYPNILSQVIKMKPIERIKELQQDMYQIGG